MSKADFDYDEAADPIVQVFGRAHSLRHLVRQVNCTIASQVSTAQDKIFCEILGKCKGTKELKLKNDNETIVYFYP